MTEMPDNLKIGKAVFDLLEQLFRDIPPEYRSFVRVDKENFRISAPSLLLSHLEQFMRYIYFGTIPTIGEDLLSTYEGIKLIPSHELAITLFHLDSPIYGNRITFKIPFMQPLASKMSDYEERIFYIRKIFDFPNTSPSQN